MKITAENVKYVANLARLRVDEADMPKYLADLEKIIDFADRLSEADTEGLQPTVHAMELHNIWREDLPKEPYDREKLLQNAPGRHGGYFAVPKVVE